MKHLPRVVPWALMLGCAVATPGVWASSDLLQLTGNAGEGQFLLHSSQGYLGVDLRDIDADRASALKLKDARGAEIVTVDHDAPAGKAGLKPHDVVLQLNGQAIEGVEQLRRMLHETPAGRTVSLVVSRDGQPINVSVQLADRAVLEQQAWSQHFSVPEPVIAPPVDGSEGFFSGRGPLSPGGSSFLGRMVPNAFYAGAAVNPVGAQLADYFGVKSGTGLLVESVDEDSPAAKAGLKAGDVILKANSDVMASRGDWMRALRTNRGKPMQLTVVRNKQEQTLTITAGEPKKKGELDPPLLLDPEMVRAEVAQLQPEEFLAHFEPINPDEITSQVEASVGAINNLNDGAKLDQELRRAEAQMQLSGPMREQMEESLREARTQMEDLGGPMEPMHCMD